VARLNGPPEAWHLGFMLGPRVNAGGRIGRADLGVRLLLEGDSVEAARIAAELDRLNSERRVIEQAAEAQAEAEALASIGLEDKIGVIVLTNADDGNPGLYVDQAFGLIAPVLARKIAEPAVAPSPSAWKAYEGLYRNASGDARVILLSTGLVMFDPSNLSNPDRIVRLLPQGEHAFRVEGGFWDGGRDGEPVLFEIGSDGRVVRVKVGPNYTMPVR